MKKRILNRLTLTISIVLIALFLLSACGGSSEPRMGTIYSYNPGPAFSTNFNDEDPRRQIKCAVVFEVLDEAAILELTDQNFIIRNSILAVLGELTMEELTVKRDLDDITQRIVVRVNADLECRVDLVIAAFFTEFAVV